MSGRKATFQELHARIIAGDPTAPSELCELLLREGLPPLTRKFKKVDEQQIVDGLTDAIIAYLDAPNAYDERFNKSLSSFIFMAATRNIQDSTKALSRSRVRDNQAQKIYFSENVELHGSASNDWIEAENLLKRKSEILEQLSGPTDRRFFEAQLAGIRDSGELAKILGVSDRSISYQRAAVKKVKDRLDKTVRRYAKKNKEK